MVAAAFAEQLLEQLANSSAPVVLQQDTAFGLVTVAAISVAAAGSGATIEAGDAAVQVPAALVSQASELAGGAALLSIGNVAEDVAEKLASDSGTSNLASAPLMIDFRDSNGTALALGRLSEPMVLELQVQGNITEHHTCAYWDEETLSWSTKGVRLLRAEDNTMLCSTTHLSVFAIIFQEALLALTCSTVAELLTAEAIQKIARPDWLQRGPALSLLFFLVLFSFLAAYAWRQDKKVEEELSWKEREQLLFKQIEAEKQKAPRGCCGTVLGQIGDVLLFLLNMFYPVGYMNLADIVRDIANAPTTSVKFSVRRVHAARAGLDMQSLQVVLHGQSKLSKSPEDNRPELNIPEVSVTVREAEFSRSSNFRKYMFQRAMSVTESFTRRRNLYSHGLSALETFVDSCWCRRVWILFGSGHPWLVLRRICMFSTARVRLALIFMKILSMGAANAVFFSSTDPNCEKQHGQLSTMVRNLTVGLVTALFSDCIIAALFMVQKVHVLSQEWTEKKKKRQRRRWLCRKVCFWTFWCLYISITLLYTIIFLANKDAAEGTQWLQATGIGVLQELVLMPLAIALSLGTASSVVLLLRPHLGEQVKAELIETEEDGEGVCNEDVREVNEETTDVTDSKETQDDKLPGGAIGPNRQNLEQLDNRPKTERVRRANEMDHL
ncbi:unnamed protein product [Effrenium voratum]|nr:unnamed protein product [Effrenium voratum]